MCYKRRTWLSFATGFNGYKEFLLTHFNWVRRVKFPDRDRDHQLSLKTVFVDCLPGAHKKVTGLLVLTHQMHHFLKIWSIMKVLHTHTHRHIHTHCIAGNFCGVKTSQTGQKYSVNHIHYLISISNFSDHNFAKFKPQ